MQSSSAFMGTCTHNELSIVQRRDVMLGIISILSMPIPTNAAQTPGEAIRKSAANLPGYGQPDIYFPRFMIGKWRVTREIVSSDDHQLRQIQLPLIVSYDVRFISVDGDIVSNQEDFNVVMDRQFNTKTYYESINFDKIRPTIQTTNWSPYNPNICTTSYSDGSVEEVKVTKRAVETNSDAGLISSSEFRRITKSVPDSMVPDIRASRALTKWKISSEDEIQGIELIYTDPSIALDPMNASVSTSMKPFLSSKSFFKLERAMNKEALMEQ